jgi:hypothetical protein
MRLNDASDVPHHRGRISAPSARRRGSARPTRSARGALVSRLRPYPPSPYELTLRLGTRIPTGVLTMPAGSVRAFREFADRVGINSFAELRSGQGGRVGGGKLVPALPNRALFENRSALTAAPKTGRRYFKNRDRSSSEHRKREPRSRRRANSGATPASRRKLDFFASALANRVGF